MRVRAIATSCSAFSAWSVALATVRLFARPSAIAASSESVVCADAVKGDSTRVSSVGVRCLVIVIGRLVGQWPGHPQTRDRYDRKGLSLKELRETQKP